MQLTPEPEQPAEIYERDLHPDMFAGMNHGKLGPQPAKQGLTLADFKEVQRQAHGLTDDELRHIPVVPEGMRLQQGATYINLWDENGQEFTATVDMVAGPYTLYISKSDVDYVLWNRLRGVNDPRRLHRADGSH